MADVAINGTGDGEISPTSLRSIGSRWVRLVLLERFDLRPYIDACHAQDVKVLGTVARESLGIQGSAERWTFNDWIDSLGEAHRLTDSPPESLNGEMSFDEAAELYEDRYGDKLDAWQVGNESDHVSPSSWTLAPDDVNRLATAFRGRLPMKKIVGPGLVSGDPGYIRGLDLRLFDGLAVHGYGQRPSGSADEWGELPGNFGVIWALFDNYARVMASMGRVLPIWATEIGISTTEVSREFQERYCGDMMATLKGNKDVAAAFWFCMGDWMVPQFGIFDGEGGSKPAAAAFTAAAGPMDPIKPPPDPKPDDPKPDEPKPDPEPKPMEIPEEIYADLWRADVRDAEYTPANDFEKYWRSRISVLGPTVSQNERPGADGAAYRAFKNGAVLRWTREKGVEVIQV